MAGTAEMAGMESHDSFASKYFRSGPFQMPGAGKQKRLEEAQKEMDMDTQQVRFRLAVSVKLPNRFTSMWCQVSQMEAELEKEREDCRD